MALQVCTQRLRPHYDANRPRSRVLAFVFRSAENVHPFPQRAGPRPLTAGPLCRFLSGDAAEVFGGLRPRCILALFDAWKHPFCLRIHPRSTRRASPYKHVDSSRVRKLFGISESALIRFCIHPHSPQREMWPQPTAVCQLAARRRTLELLSPA